MGVGIRSAFNIGKRALQAQVAGLNITGNNIANVNTEGYSRQELILNPSSPLSFPEGAFGTGVEIDGVRRIRDSLVDKQLRTEIQNMSEKQVLAEIYQQLETVINEPSDNGLRSMMSEFFDNFHELANDPEAMPIRFNLRAQAEIMVEGFHRIDEQLRILGEDIDSELGGNILRFNELTKEVSELNSQIVAFEGVSKGDAADLRDSRDRALDEMSEIMEIFVFEKPSGIVNVASRSETLITSNYPVQFELKNRNVEGNLITEIFNIENDSQFIPYKGKLGGLVLARNELIPQLREQFNELAKSLVDKVNGLHRNGAGLKGSSSVVPADLDFFVGENAFSIDIANDIKQDLRNIAAAQNIQTVGPGGTIVNNAAPGDNRIAMEIANLKTKAILNNNTESLIDVLNRVVSEVGNSAKSTFVSVKNSELMIEQFQNVRSSTSGVSLDEEFVSLIKYQRGYQASAKMITTIDEMFNSLINMV